MTENEKHLSIEELRSVIVCNAKGELFWKRRTHETHRGKKLVRWNTRYADKPAFFTVGTKGYLRGIIYRRSYCAHRVIYALHHGKWPDQIVDHINGIVGDNRIENLRDVSLSENARNAKRYSSNTSGRGGVHFQKAANKYQAYVRVGEKRQHLGYFSSFDEAVAARVAAEKHYGFSPNHGMPR